MTSSLSRASWLDVEAHEREIEGCTRMHHAFQAGLRAMQQGIGIYDGCSKHGIPACKLLDRLLERLPAQPVIARADFVLCNGTCLQSNKGKGGARRNTNLVKLLSSRGRRWTCGSDDGGRVYLSYTATHTLFRAARSGVTLATELVRPRLRLTIWLPPRMAVQRTRGCRNRSGEYQSI